MNPDKTTKILLAVIAIGLLLNALNPWIDAAPVAAQAPPANLPMMEVHLRNIESYLEGIDGQRIDGTLRNVQAQPRQHSDGRLPFVRGLLSRGQTGGSESRSAVSPTTVIL